MISQRTGIGARVRNLGLWSLEDEIYIEKMFNVEGRGLQPDQFNVCYIEHN